LPGKALVQSADRLFTHEHGDQPLDLPPAREEIDIALLAASVRSRRRFDIGCCPEMIDQIRRALINIAIRNVDQRPIELFKHDAPVMFCARAGDTRIMPAIMVANNELSFILKRLFIITKVQRTCGIETAGTARPPLA